MAADRPSDRPIDVFISYKSEERPAAERLALALERRWSVWWDHHLLAGDAYRKVIGEQLRAATCVVVLWSHRSVESEFVLDEAQRAHRRGVLLPVRIDAVEVPLGFGQLDYTDLVDWDGDEAHPGFHELCSAIARRLNQPVAAPLTVSPLQQVQGLARRRPIALGVAGLLLVALGVATIRRTPTEATNAPAETAVRSGGSPLTAETSAPIAVQIVAGGQVMAAGTVIPSGLVVTPCHVVGDAEELTLRGAGPWDGPAKVIERRCEVDLVLLEPARGPMLPNTSVVRFAGSLEVGEPIERYRGRSDRTPGKVISPSKRESYLGGEQRAMRVLVTTNVSAGGDSGAPILDGQGRIVGILVAGDGATKSLSIPTETMRETFINRFTP